MLPLLTARHWPQTLLLTALFLLIAVATTLLACGPAAPPAPADDGALPAAQQKGEAADPTEPPPPPTVPTPSYPKIRSSLQSEVVEFEEAQDAASGPSGQSDTAPEDTVVFVEIFLSGNKKAEVAAWLRSKGITPAYEDNPYTVNLGAEVPLSLLGELSQQDGVTGIQRPPQPPEMGW